MAPCIGKLRRSFRTSTKHHSSWLGPEAFSLHDLALAAAAPGLSTTDLLGARVLATFSDHQPFLTERALGRGALFTVALPTSVEHSNFPLRPAFLALLDHLLDEEAPAARRNAKRGRHGTGSSRLGASVSIDGPRGPLSVHERSAPSGGSTESRYAGR